MTKPSKIPKRLVVMPVEVFDGNGQPMIADVPIEMSVLCATCLHLGNGLTCEAFRGGIPREIWSEGFDHRGRFKGDHGITYELAPGVQSPPELRR